MLDMNDVITDVTVSNTVAGEFVKTWLGRPWIETVAHSGVEKARRSLKEARFGGLSAYQQILQRFPSGLELPIEYTTVRLGNGAGFIAVGRNLQASAELQSRLLAAQEAMERDYWKLREVETRYRLLFDASNEAVLVLSSDDLRVTEANPAAIRALGLTRGWTFLSEIAPHEQDSFRAMLARVRESGRAPGGVFHIGAQQAPWTLRASLMSDNESSLYLLQLGPVGPLTALAPPKPLEVNGILQHMPDGFAVLDRDGVVRSANRAFLELIQLDTETEVVGQTFDRWVRQDGSDFFIDLRTQVRSGGRVHARLAAVLGEKGRNTAVEISAGADPSGSSGFIGVALREVGVPPPVSRTGGGAQPLLPALAPVGATPLKTLVQAAVEVVERHYVESALQSTEGNRTAAAVRLGLSRQSLYAKLNRYGIDSGLDGTSSSSD